MCSVGLATNMDQVELEMMGVLSRSDWLGKEKLGAVEIVANDWV